MFYFLIFQITIQNIENRSHGYTNRCGCRRKVKWKNFSLMLRGETPNKAYIYIQRWMDVSMRREGFVGDPNLVPTTNIITSSPCLRTRRPCRTQITLLLAGNLHPWLPRSPVRPLRLSFRCTKAFSLPFSNFYYTYVRISRNFLRQLFRGRSGRRLVELRPRPAPPPYPRVSVSNLYVSLYRAFTSSCPPEEREYQMRENLPTSMLLAKCTGTKLCRTIHIFWRIGHQQKVG